MNIGNTTNISKIEEHLWSSADTLRANSGLASNEYFMPVMGLIFLRHAYKRFLDAKVEIEKDLPSRGGKTRGLTKEDFSQKAAIFLKPEAQYDHLASLPENKNIQKAVIDAMKSIEEDYSSLKGVLPKIEFNDVPDDVLRTLIRNLNPDELKKANGDVFGRIYEYFLTKFAGDKAHDGGEFFTPVSLVSVIAHVLEPREGIVLDPACGSGGMFVQSAKFLEEQHGDAGKKLIFKGIEKNKTTVRLGKMNLAVHGLEGQISEGITYYNDPHDLNGKASYVMANPPFNVDEIDAKIKDDPRLAFGLPGVSNGKVQNGNYVWINYFYSYLNEKGRAGFVMSSQASGAGGDQATVREKLIKSGDVDAMMAIRSGFFYTRAVPCELWFLDKDKPKEHKDTVLMIDARNVYRKVTRTVNDFSPEQLNNLLSIVWLYRGENERFIELVGSHLQKMFEHVAFAQTFTSDETAPAQDSLTTYLVAITQWIELMQPFLKEQVTDGVHIEAQKELEETLSLYKTDLKTFVAEYTKLQKNWKKGITDIKVLEKTVVDTETFADKSRDLVKQTDLIYRLSLKLRDICLKDLNARTHSTWKNPEITKVSKTTEELREKLTAILKEVRYFHKHAVWLTQRFPGAKLHDVEGLVKVVSQKELSENDWSLTPGRYVGVAPEVEDEDFDFEESLRELHIELEGLNAEAVELAAKIKSNFDGLGI
jgi:type I restriction enzyme M protein